MEGLKEQLNLSEQQQEKVEQLSYMIKSFSESISDSMVADEVKSAIKKFEKDITDQYGDPQKYYLWSLVPHKNSEESGNATEFDTNNGDIEAFIIDLVHSQQSQ